MIIWIFILLPWLNPFASGPSPAVEPLLFSWTCIAGVLFAGSVSPHRSGSETLIRAIAGAWLLAALLSSLMGLLQYFGASAVFGQWVNSTAMGEAYANLRQRNQFATLTNIGLAALLWWQVQARSSHRPSIVLMAGAALLAMGNAASSSRTGLLQLLVLFVMIWFWSHRANSFERTASRRVILIALVSYAVAAYFLPILAGFDPNASGILARLHSGDPPCASRLTLWANVLHLITQKPWLGWGWGNLDYAHFVTLYPGARFCDILDNAHNLPLHLAVELGVPLALLVCATGLWLVLRAQPWRERHPTRQLAWSVLAVILLHSLLEYPLWYGPFQMAFGLSLWMLWCSRGHGAENSERIWPLAPLLCAVVATVMIAFCAYAAWDYHRISQIYLPQAMRSAAYRDNTMEKLQGSWLFKDQVNFAQLTTEELTPANAAQINALAKDLLHFSPEARVAEKVIESATMLGHNDEALVYLARYRAAFPANHARWLGKNQALVE